MSGKRIIGPIPTHYLRLMRPAERTILGKAGQLPEEIQIKHDHAYEKKLQNQIESLFRRLAITANRSRMDKRKTDKTGWPDFTFAVLYKGDGETFGQACAMECKSPTGKLSTEQTDMRTKLERDGWKYFVIRTYEQARACLLSLGVKS